MIYLTIVCSPLQCLSKVIVVVAALNFLLNHVDGIPSDKFLRKMDVDSLGKLLVEEIEKYKKAMGIAVKEEKNEDAVKDKTDKEITEMKKSQWRRENCPCLHGKAKSPRMMIPKIHWHLHHHLQLLQGLLMWGIEVET